MFEINKENSAIQMHRGDTGAYWVTLRKKNDGGDFEDGDVALFTVKQNDRILIDREYPLNDDDGAGNGRFLVAFRNSDTDTWPGGTYTTEIRVALHPVRNRKLIMTVAAAGQTPITATVNETTCLQQFTDESGIKTLTFTTEWSENPTTYGITVTGTPTNGDTITLQYNKLADGKIADGNTIRTITKSKSTLTIIDVQKEI